jgi:3-mercaptopyruvate sulfurtransferase SseA
MPLRIVVELVVLAAVAALLALGINLLREEPFPFRITEEFYRIESGAKPLTLSNAHRHFDEGRAIFVDARTSEEFEEEQIEGALNVPIEQWEEIYPALSPWIEGQPVVLYAGRDWIGPADDLAAGLAARGHGDSLFIFLEGFEVWREAGLPTISGPDQILGGSIEEEW